MTVAAKKRQSEPAEPDASQNMIVAIGFQREGATYRLHPTSAARMREAFPEAHPAPSVYVGYATRDEFEALHGPMWPQIVSILTRLDANKLKKKFGRLLLWDPATNRQWEHVDGELTDVT